MRRLVLFLFFFHCTVLFAQNEVKISWDYSGLTFKEFAEKAEINDSINFFFRDEWVKGLKLGLYDGPVLLSDLLDSLFKGDSLFYFSDDPRYIYITKSFAIKVNKKTEKEVKTYLKPTDYELETVSQQSGNIFFQIGDPAEKNRPGYVTLSGYITDRETREPVPGATVYIEKISRGTLSNRYGYYSLILPRGLHQIRFSFIGMKDKTVNANIYRSGEMNIDMSSTLIPLRETVITAERNVVLQRTEVGVEKIDISIFKMMPAAMGEADIIKSILLVTGVQTIGEGSMGFNVRGGSADQNLILLYGAPVYNSSHFFGFFSSVNSDIIKEATLYKGGMPARYGGRISSVLDISAREGNRKELFGNAGISPVTTHILLEGPIKKDTGSFILTGRTTYSNWVMHLIQDKAIRRSRANFYDINAKVTYDLDKNNKIDFSSYVSHDGFKFNSDTLYTYNNRIIALMWRHFFHSRFLSTVTLNNSDYNYTISSTSHPSEAFTMSHRINSTGLKADFNMYGGRHEINYGIDITRYAVNPGTYLPASDSSIIARKIIPEEKAFESSVYFEDKIALNENISFVGGIRLSSFLAYGEKTVMLYDPRVTRSESSITDSLKFGRREISEGNFGPEFRASLNIRTTDRSSVKFNYNRTRQNLHLLSNTVSISPSDTWKLCDYYLKPITGDQYAAGYYRMLFGNRIEASAEIYYKVMRNAFDFKGGTRLVMNENIETDVLPVKGKAYGLELSMKRSAGKFRWSAGYTYSRTFLKSTGSFRDEIINGGKWFPANFDRTNDLILSFNYLISRRFSFSSNYTLTSGRPITYPVASYYMNDVLLLQYSERNKYRIPVYSRLDLSFRISGTLKAHKLANPHWIFSVYNVLSRQNVYSIYFTNNKNQVKGYKMSVFGRAIPSLTLSFDFFNK
ncbi:MAG TPA: TonB-dependent receptor [Bacteroidales bacterium]|nr:TonB-dependent receptor [Bacteroidales bacterium]